MPKSLYCSNSGISGSKGNYESGARTTSRKGTDYGSLIAHVRTSYPDLPGAASDILDSQNFRCVYGGHRDGERTSTIENRGVYIGHGGIASTVEFNCQTAIRKSNGISRKVRISRRIGVLDREGDCGC